MPAWQDPWEAPQQPLPSADDIQEWWRDDDRIENFRRERAMRATARYYCPLCGEVGYGYKGVKGWVVESHSRCIPGPSQAHHDFHYSRCPGGSIDPTKDKAP